MYSIQMGYFRISGEQCSICTMVYRWLVNLQIGTNSLDMSFYYWIHLNFWYYNWVLSTKWAFGCYYLKDIKLFHPQFGTHFYGFLKITETFLFWICCCATLTHASGRITGGFITSATHAQFCSRSVNVTITVTAQSWCARNCGCKRKYHWFYVCWWRLEMLKGAYYDFWPDLIHFRFYSIWTVIIRTV